MRGTSGRHRGGRGGWKGGQEGAEVGPVLLHTFKCKDDSAVREWALGAGWEGGRKRSTLISAKQECVNERRSQTHVEMVNTQRQGSYRAAEECLQRVVKHLLL